MKSTVADFIKEFPAIQSTRAERIAGLTEIYATIVDIAKKKRYAKSTANNCKTNKLANKSTRNDCLIVIDV